jgi:hypothetical protein
MVVLLDFLQQPTRSSAISWNVRPSPIQDGRLLGQFRVPLANHVHVLRIEFHAVADALGQVSGGERRATPQEGLINHFAALGVIQNRAPHQLHRLLRGMIKFLLIAVRVFM